MGEDAFARAIDTLRQLQDSGKVRQVGLSNVSKAQIDYAMRQLPVVAVSNLYSLAQRQDDAVLDHCSALELTYLPYFSLSAGRPLEAEAVRSVAFETGATPAQVAISWLLARSPVVVPIPGTSDAQHLYENMAAASLELDGDALRRLERVSSVVADRSGDDAGTIGQETG
jgi:pyridoxine 4-dehydrogenase